MSSAAFPLTREQRGAMFVQAARGPVLLITVGILFAMHQAGRLSFGRSWPLLIIVLGVMKLIERVLAPVPPRVVPPDTVPPYGPGAASHGMGATRRTPPVGTPPGGGGAV